MRPSERDLDSVVPELSLVTVPVFLPITGSLYAVVLGVQVLFALIVLLMTKGDLGVSLHEGTHLKESLDDR